MSKNGDHLSNLMPLVSPGLLMIAHLMAEIALLSFGARVEGYPLHTTGLAVYVMGVILAAVGLTVQAQRLYPVRSDSVSLLLLSAPAFASLVFVAGLWMTPPLGGALYAPYDPGDPDIAMFFSLFFAALFSVVSILYGSFGYLIVVCAAQMALYVGTHAFPNYLLYPSAGLLGVRPSTFAALVGVYGLGAVLLLLRAAIFGRRKKPGLWVAAALTGLVGAWVLYVTLTWLPDNGAHLGYVRADLYVPEQAWDWTRPAAQGMAAAAMAAAALSALVSLAQICIRNSHKRPANSEVAALGLD